MRGLVYLDDDDNDNNNI